MRICIFSRLTSGHQLYAPPMPSDLLAKTFCELGHDVTVLTTALTDQNGAVDKTNYAAIHFLAGTAPGEQDERFWQASGETFDAMHDKDPFDLVVGRGLATWGFHHGSRASGKVPVVAHEGTYPRWLHKIESRMPNQAGAISRPLALLRLPIDRRYRECLQRADVAVGNSPALAQALRRISWWNQPTTEYIPYGFDLEPWPKPQETWQKDDPPRMVFVGRLTTDKGALDLIDILAQMRHPTAILEAIGPVSDRLAIRLRAMAEQKGVSDRFVMPGPERHENIPMRLKGAVAFLFPSTHPEGLSKSVMEAMAASLPVVAYQIPGMDVLVENDQTGWLVPHAATAIATEKLDRLIAEPELAKSFGQSAYNRLVSDFSIAAASSRWETLLAKVVRNR